MRSEDDTSGKHAGFTNVLLLVSKQEVQWYNFFTKSMSVAVLVVLLFFVRVLLSLFRCTVL